MKICTLDNALNKGPTGCDVTRLCKLSLLSNSPGSHRLVAANTLRVTGKPGEHLVVIRDQQVQRPSDVATMYDAVKQGLHPSESSCCRAAMN